MIPWFLFSLHKGKPHHLPIAQMEDPKHSSMGKTHCSKEATALSEESGWTSYLEDFLASQKKEGSTCSGFSPSIGGGSSMVSDATSCVACKPPAHAEPSKGCKKLSFKKRKARVTLGHDDPLEDTASSPLNSPKVKIAQVLFSCHSSHTLKLLLMFSYMV